MDPKTVYFTVGYVLIKTKIRNIYLINCDNHCECKVNEIHTRHLPQIYSTQEGPLPDNLRDICNYTTLINVDQEACVVFCLILKRCSDNYIRKRH